MRKFTEMQIVDDYEVLTDKGFVDVQAIMTTVPYTVHVLVTDAGHFLYAADDHLLIDASGDTVAVKDALNKTIKVNGGTATVTHVIETGERVPMYDLQIAAPHTFYTNEILSHNTTTVAGYLLHLAMFNEDYSIAILANKKAQATEVLDRIKTIYECLPWWLQIGVRRWNVGDILLDGGKKGSKISTSATKGGGIRGKSVNCLTGTARVRVYDTFTGAVEDLYLSELYNRLKTHEIASNRPSQDTTQAIK